VSTSDIQYFGYVKFVCLVINGKVSTQPHISGTLTNVNMVLVLMAAMDLVWNGLYAGY